MPTVDSALFRRWAPCAAVILYLLAVFAWLQARPGGLIERDGYFHARMAQLLPERGLSRSFPWTQASTWRDRFCDKEFLYHLLMAPFAQGEEPVLGVKLFAVLLSAGVFAAFAAFLTAHGARWTPLWCLALASMGGPFLLRMSFIRPHVLSVLLFLAGLHLLIRVRRRALAALGFVTAWSYSFPFVLPILAVPFALGRLWAGEEPDWRSVAALFAGTLAGLLIHPYSPHTLESLLTYLQILTIAAGKRGLAAVELGREFAPYGTRDFLLAYPLLTATVLVLGLAGWRSRRKFTGEAMGLYAAALAAFAGTMVFARAAEYAAPLAAAAAAFAFRDAVGAEEISRLKLWASRRAARAWLAALMLLVPLGAAQLHALAYLDALSAGNDPPRFRRAARWMERYLEPDETVVNLWWDDFPDLFYDAHRQRFLVGLDPTYMLRFDRDAALALERMRSGRAPIDAALLSRLFGARYMILRAPNARLYPQLAGGPWRPVYADEQAAIYALSGPDGPPPEAWGLPVIPPLGG